MGFRYLVVGPRIPQSERCRDLAAELSAELRAALEPLLAEIESVSQRIAAYDRQIEQIAKEKYPEVSLLAPQRVRMEGWRQRRRGSEPKTK